jgi:hypothetical protein
MIKTGTSFTCHLSTRLCTRIVSTSSQNEFATVQWLKLGWKTYLRKMFVEKTQDNTMSESSQSEKPLEVETEEEFSRNTG